MLVGVILLTIVAGVLEAILLGGGNYLLSFLFGGAGLQTQLGISGEIDFEKLLRENFPDFYSKYQEKHNLSAIFGFHKKLVDILSLSTHEEQIGHYLVQFLESQGLVVEILPIIDSSRFNIYAYYNNDDNGKNRRVLLTSHIDTVPPYIAYHFNSTSGAITGRGTNDAKASIVNQIYSVFELVLERKIRAEKDVAFLYVVGEEIDGDGMAAAVASLQDSGHSWDVAIFGEPTENKLGKGHKGNYMFDIEAYGQAAHSGYPQLGVSSNEIMVDFLHRLDILAEKYPYSELLGPTTFNIGKLQGGIAMNVLPSFSSAGIFFRVADNLDELHLIINQVLNDTNSKYVQKYPHFVGPKAPDGINGPFIYRENLSTKSPQFLDYNVPGFDAIALAFATDIPGFTIPVARRYLYGPGSIFSAHGDHEFVTIQELVENLEGYKKLILYNLE